MKVRPILMSAPMVQSLLADRKTQTRRMIRTKMHGRDLIDLSTFDDEDYKSSYGNVARNDPKGWGFPWMIEYDAYTPSDLAQWGLSPYGKPGDLLWVRETFKTIDDVHFYRANYWKKDPIFRNWKPSIFMPRHASRLTLELTGVRVERLSDLTDADAMAEGLAAITKDGQLFKYGIPDRDGLPGTDNYGWPWNEWSVSPRGAYFRLWDKINGPLSCGEDPWLWVMQFTVHQINIDAFVKAKEAVAA